MAKGRSKNTTRVAKRTSRVRGEVKTPSAPATQGIQFRVTDDAILAKSATGGGERISSRIEVAAKTRDAAGVNWGRLLQWTDGEGNAHECVVAAAELNGQ